MPDNKPNIKLLETKLLRLAKCILRKAQDDHEFAAQLLDTLSNTEERKGEAKRLPEDPKSSFNVVEFLHLQGREKLQQELNLMTDSELRALVRSEGIAKGKDSKSLIRHQLVEALLVHSTRRLSQGSAFLKE
ncbi:hypothetical protein QQ056_01095 [Oscillatoria laete-virens NRMC-F 0139]|nr:hypothetical protein [Oscillatoria laete-virens]MDL5052167.1 hypothetical protein [Oscillatoria laete-virens NRMC-F 0139]